MDRIFLRKCDWTALSSIGLLFLVGCETSNAPGPTVQATPKYSLNDTGVTKFSGSPTPITASQPAAPALTTTSQNDHPGQDADNGRDATANDDSDGKAGFSFSKLDDTGKPLADQTVNYNTQAWNCVRDNVTGLTWEVKAATNGPRYYANKYTWYDTDPTTNGGGAGSEGDDIICGKTLASCNTQAYKTYLNTLDSNKGLCGFKDWRLPTREELRSIVNYGAAASPLIDESFLGKTEATDHWTSQTALYRDDKTGDAWELHFDTGQSEAHGKGSKSVDVRMVRGPSL